MACTWTAMPLRSIAASDAWRYLLFVEIAFLR